MAYTRTTPRYVFFGPNSANFSVPPSTEVGNISDYRAGEKVANWRKLVKSGSSAGSGYTRDSYVIESMFSGFAKLVTNDFEYEGQVVGPNISTEVCGGFPPVSGGRVPATHITTDISAIDGESLTLLYKKIRQESSHMNGLQFLGELREAIRMIKRPAEAIRNGLVEYDRLLRKRKKSIYPHIPLRQKLDTWQRIAAGTWLEVSFGWKPLVSDTQAIAETIGRITLPDSRRTRVRAYKEGNLGSSMVSQNNSYMNSTAINCTTTTSSKTTGGVQYIVGLKVVPVGVPVNQLDRIRSLSGLTLENFVPTLYELTPWSFLVDYFTNVGDIINCAFTNTADVTWQVRTTRLRTERACSSDPWISMAQFNPPYYNFRGFTAGNSTSRVVKSTVTREVLTHLSVPSLVFRLPESAWKWTNIAALMSPRYSSSFRF